MSRNGISPEDKILAVRKYLDGKISQGGIVSRFQVSKTSIQQWIFNYQSMGSEIFFQKKNKWYSKELKECVSTIILLEKDHRKISAEGMESAQKVIVTIT